MRPILTPDNPQSTMLFVHADGVCLRYIARHITGLHVRVVDIAEQAVDGLAQGDRPDDP
jgi:hypothetical protein